MGPAPDCPSTRAAQVLATSFPTGVTSPRPVSATRRVTISLSPSCRGDRSSPPRRCAASPPLRPGCRCRRGGEAAHRRGGDDLSPRQDGEREIVTRRVALTGLGLVTPVGNDVASTWAALVDGQSGAGPITRDRKSTRLNSSHPSISYAVFCL